MAWYNVGTITVTNGSMTVTGAGTTFVRNVQDGDALLVAGGAPLEIASVQSATQLTLASPWLGATAGGQSYKVQPTVGIYIDVALRALNMLGPFQAILDGIGQGLIPSGTLAAPGIRFAADQDTGLRRIGDNALSLVTGGVDRLVLDAAGYAGFGISNPQRGLHLYGGTDASKATLRVHGDAGNPGKVQVQEGGSVFEMIGGSQLVFAQNGVAERMRIDPHGNLLVGTLTGAEHRIRKEGAVNSGATILHIMGTGAFTASFYGVSGGQGSGANTAMRLAVDANTGRSINAGGTLNAGGADYAEYMTKADGCGDIAKGEVCGVDRDGRLTRSWTAAIRYVVKSTDPNLVGGDTWSAHLPPRPDAPGGAPIVPVMPPLAAADTPVEPVREDGEEEIDFIRRMAGYLVAVSTAATGATADREAMLAYQAATAAYPAAKAAHDAATATYERESAAWDASLEAARQTVDRIAFCGQVPVNVGEEVLAICEGALEDGEAVYLVAVARGGGIGAQAVRERDMSLPLYMRRLGAVWAIRDGRPIIDVQHG